MCGRDISEKRPLLWRVLLFVTVPSCIDLGAVSAGQRALLYVVTFLDFTTKIGDMYSGFSNLSC